MAEEKRVYFLDNLRVFLVFLVLMFHAGLVYESSGLPAFFWIVDDPATSDLPGLLNMVIEIFVMSGLFFVAGYFAPLSHKGRTDTAFVWGKIKRLMIPWAAAVMTLVPLYLVIFRYSRKLPQQDWTGYFHFSNGMFSQNWLWFLPVLFLFNLLFLLIAKHKVDISSFTLKKAVPLVFFAGFIYTLSFDLLKLNGWTKTVVIDFQNERLLVYFLYFLLGSLCFKQRTFEGRGSQKSFLWVSAIAWIPVVSHIVLVLFPFFIRPGEYLGTKTIHTVLKHITLHLSILCQIYTIVNLFRFFIRGQGKLMKMLSSSSYGVYILHVIVLGVIATLMLGTPLPSLLKYSILTVSTWIVCNLLTISYRSIIGRKSYREE